MKRWAKILGLVALIGAGVAILKKVLGGAPSPEVAAPGPPAQVAPVSDAALPQPPPAGDAEPEPAADPVPDSEPATPAASDEPVLREVDAAGRDDGGKVASLHGTWGTVSRDDAIAQITAGTHRYVLVGGRTVSAVNGARGAYLRSGPGDAAAPKLDDLPRPEGD